MNKYKMTIIILIVLGLLMFIKFFPKYEAPKFSTSTDAVLETYQNRKMLAVREQSTDPLLNCYALADETYFDSWSLKCESYYEEHRTENYIRCLSLATTSANKSNIYKEVKMIRRPHPNDCEILKEANVFPSDCRLLDGRGKEDTIRWQEEIDSCNKKYGATQ